MHIPEKFISCDWGTSNFRLRVIDTKTLAILDEYKTTRGVNDVYNEFKSQRKIDQGRFFSNFLQEELGKITDLKNDNVIVASGMISSSIGMRELGYSQMPFKASGNNLFSKLLSINKNLSVLMISGARTDSDVMRGEEIQAVGLSPYLPVQKEGLLILPGTHSKHLSFKENNYTNLDTYMTGEMFKLFSKNSIISNSVEEGEFTDLCKTSFLDGVKDGADDGVNKHLFKIRAFELLGRRKKVESYYYLSGLLIGEELSYLRDIETTICMAASGIINDLYQIALKFLIKKEENLIFFDEEQLEKALLMGQRKILEQYA